MERIERAGGTIAGGRLVSDLRLDQATGAVNAVVSRDREGNQTVHEADAVVFAIGIAGGDLSAEVYRASCAALLAAGAKITPVPCVGCISCLCADLSANSAFLPWSHR